MSVEERIQAALKFASECAGIEGDHHRAWLVDQMVRILTGCPMVQMQFIDCLGKPYPAEVLGESEEYRAFVARAKAGSDGPETYSWDEGIVP